MNIQKYYVYMYANVYECICILLIFEIIKLLRGRFEFLWVCHLLAMCLWPFFE